MMIPSEMTASDYFWECSTDKSLQTAFAQTVCNLREVHLNSNPRTFNSWPLISKVPFVRQLSVSNIYQLSHRLLLRNTLRNKHAGQSRHLIQMREHGTLRLVRALTLTQLLNTS